MLRTLKTLSAGAIALAMGLSVSSFDARAQTAAEFYKGKTLTYIIATKPGGGYDTYGRLTAKYMAKHLGAKIGFLSVLHTWGQNLMHHPHIHCIVPGGGGATQHRRTARGGSHVRQDSSSRCEC